LESNQRLIVTVVLCFVIAVGFQFLWPKLFPPPPEAVAPVAAVGAVEAEAPKAGEPTAGAPVVAAPGAAPTIAPAAAAALPEQLVTLRSEEFELVFSSHGAGLSNVRLLGPKNRRPGKEGAQVDLGELLVPGDERLLETKLGGAVAALPVRAPCAVTAEGPMAVTFLCTSGEVSIQKAFSIAPGFGLKLVTTVRNAAAEAREATLGLRLVSRVDSQKQSGSGGGCASPMSELPMPTESVCRHGDEVTRHLFDEDELTLPMTGAASFAGISERYFAAVAIPHVDGGVASCSLEALTVDRPGATLTSKVNVPAGGEATVTHSIYLGAKDLNRLEAASATLGESAGQDPSLPKLVDFGMWAVIARLLLWVMRWFHALIPNWGIAIILLTITVKAVTFPLAWKSMKSMEGLRVLAPELEKLKAKFGEDKDKLNMETLKLYQQHKVNPFGGCLPILIQMPVWIALYSTLQTSVELYNEPFLSVWLTDLTSKDPYYVLPLLMGVTMFATQKMQPSTGMDPAQAKMMLYFMPIMFTAFMLNLPQGLTLYIFTNNLLSIAQQLALRRVMGLPMFGPPTKPAGA
jgi:YidC/Oxa1 family membrane protein insertase